ncbi:hypothetical protein UFOVP191_41 [uncultured Caudovirales phage]|uniref:Restriction alleviation protein Lar n=1 Tax=uncultured Caudovirales phage TaxID=2100421 RepID=A0A6J7WL18_9CAUD|nr:hypothetical protein UFOVP191_41 [uncultured Caudovirales phage]
MTIDEEALDTRTEVEKYGLKPCPFCGGEASVTRTRYYLGYGCNNRSCDVLPSTQCLNSWNNRVRME